MKKVMLRLVLVVLSLVLLLWLAICFIFFEGEKAAQLQRAKRKNISLRRLSHIRYEVLAAMREVGNKTS